MKVLIINTNRNRAPLAVLPYGACVAAQSALRAGHEVRFLDLMFARAPARALDKALAEFKPDLAGFSVRNIDNNDLRTPVAFFEEAAALMRRAGKRKDLKIVLGGAAAGVMPGELLKAGGADWAVLGDAPAVFPRLLSAVERGEDPLRIPGVAAVRDGRPVLTPLTFGGWSGGDLFPEFARWLDLKAYAGLMAAVPMKTKLGCPFNCVYCTYAASEGRAYRLCPPEEAAAKVRALALAGVRDIEFVDNVFNSPYEHALRLCRLLAGRPCGARLHTMELNPAFTDRPLLEAMEAAGFAGIGVTAESAADAVLSALGKNYGGAQVRAAAEAVNRGRLPCMWIFMLGGPGETRATVKRALDFAKRELRPSDSVFFNLGVRIYPGTPLETLARAEGTLTVPASEMLAPVFYVSPSVGKEWLLETLGAAVNENMNFINSDSLALPFLSGLSRLANLAGVSPPLWRHTRVLRRGLRFMGVKA
ncbi:MAG: radical SAM protein [Elusimicrobiales bacterium]|jgi:radical SAM superfamily enzyme YgiQ (UPF0313 family)